MSSSYSCVPLPWVDLWQYASGLPVVLAGPFAPLVAYTLPPTDWSAWANPFMMFPCAVASTLAIPNRDDPPS